METKKATEKNNKVKVKTAKGNIEVYVAKVLEETGLLVSKTNKPVGLFFVKFEDVVSEESK